MKVPGITFAERFKHFVLLLLVPYDHYGCRRCEKVDKYFRDRLRCIQPPPVSKHA